MNRAVIAFPLQNAPEALHRAVVNAMRHAGHTLRHARLHKLVVEGTVGVLKTSVAVEQRMRVRIGLRRLVEGFENQWVIVLSLTWMPQSWRRSSLSLR